MKLAVWKHDGGKCVICGATDELHFDHIIPFSKGGTSLRAELDFTERRLAQALEKSGEGSLLLTGFFFWNGLYCVGQGCLPC